MRRCCTTTCSPRTSSRSRPSRRTSPSGSYFNKGNVEAGFKQAEVIVEGRYTTEPVHQAYIEPHACLCSYGADGQCTVFSSSQGHFMVRSYVAKLLGIDISNIRAHAGRDRRRVRRQDAGVSGAAGARAVEEVRPAGEDADDAGGSVPRLRSDLGRHHGGEDRRQEGRHHRRGEARAEVPGRRLPRLADPARLHVRLRDVRPAEHRGHRLRRGEQPAEGRRLSCAGRADRLVRGGMRAGRPGAQARHGSDRAPREERREERHQDPLRADASEHRLPRHAGGGEEQRALEVAAEAGPGPRHRHRLLVQHRRRILGRGARGRGRHGGGGVGQPGYRRLARLDRHDGGRDAADSGREGAHDRRRYRLDRLHPRDRRQSA